MHSGQKLFRDESDKLYDVGSEFKFFRLDRGFMPQHLYDRMQDKKLDLSGIGSTDTTDGVKHELKYGPNGANGEEGIPFYKVK